MAQMKGYIVPMKNLTLFSGKEYPCRKVFKKWMWRRLFDISRELPRDLLASSCLRRSPLCAGNYRGTRSKHQKARQIQTWSTVPGEWIKNSPEGVASLATREEIMLTLEDVQHVLIRYSRQKLCKVQMEFNAGVIILQPIQEYFPMMHFAQIQKLCPVAG